MTSIKLNHNLKFAQTLSLWIKPKKNKKKYFLHPELMLSNRVIKLHHPSESSRWKGKTIRANTSGQGRRVGGGGRLTSKLIFWCRPRLCVSLLWGFSTADYIGPGRPIKSWISPNAYASASASCQSAFGWFSWGVELWVSKPNGVLLRTSDEKNRRRSKGNWCFIAQLSKSFVFL